MTSMILTSPLRSRQYPVFSGRTVIIMSLWWPTWWYKLSGLDSACVSLCSVWTRLTMVPPWGHSIARRSWKKTETSYCLQPSDVKIDKSSTMTSGGTSGYPGSFSIACLTVKKSCFRNCFSLPSSDADAINKQH